MPPCWLYCTANKDLFIVERGGVEVDWSQMDWERQIRLRDWKHGSQKQAKSWEGVGDWEAERCGKGRETWSFGFQARRGAAAWPRRCEADAEKAIENQEGGATLRGYGGLRPQEVCQVKESWGRLGANFNSFRGGWADRSAWRVGI